MTVMISPNPDKQLADVIAVRAAQILLNHGSHVLMREELQASCNTMGVSYLPEKECLQQADVILTIGGDGTILHEANLTLEYKKPILGVNLGRCQGRVLAGQPDAALCAGAGRRQLERPRPERCGRDQGPFAAGY